MAENAGESADLIIKTVRDAWRRALIDVEICGYNFASGEIEDFEKVGIFDPAKVTITALVDANSAVSTLITSGHAIVEV